MKANLSHTTTFTKAERLKSRSLITRLFAEGQSKLIYPFRIVWLPTILSSETSFNTKKNSRNQQIYPAKFSVSVSKRHFSNATDRNRIKRQIRECYRLQKPAFYDALDKKMLAIDQQKQALDADQREVLVIMFLYVPKKKLDYDFLFQKMGDCLRALSR